MQTIVIEMIITKYENSEPNFQEDRHTTMKLATHSMEGTEDWHTAEVVFNAFQSFIINHYKCYINCENNAIQITFEEHI